MSAGGQERTRRFIKSVPTGPPVITRIKRVPPKLKPSKSIKPGKEIEFEILQTVDFTTGALTSDRTLETNSDLLSISGHIVGMVVSASSGSPERGQCYAQVTISRGGEDPTNDLFELGKGYVTPRSGPHGAGSIPVELSDRIVVRSKTGATATLLVRISYLSSSTTEVNERAIGWEGTDEDSLAGRGHLFIFQSASDITGNLSHTFNPNRSGIHRIIHGFTLLYDANTPVTDRTPFVEFRRPLAPTAPSGFGAAQGVVWKLTGPTLGAIEEGVMYVGADGWFSSTSDNDVVTIQNNASVKTPFPLTVTNDDSALRFFFDITNGNVNDHWDVNWLIEEWIDFEA
jgi:hypothetical protein